MKPTYYFSPPWPERSGKTALVTGITGQDGSYLAELLLERATRSGAGPSHVEHQHGRIDHLYEPCFAAKRLFLDYGDLSDASSVTVLKTFGPTRSTISAPKATSGSASTSPNTPPTSPAWHRPPSRSDPRPRAHARFYQASSSELFGKVVETPQSETTPFYPRSPYAAAKVYAFTSPATTARPTACSRSTASCSTTSPRAAARPS